MSISMYRAYISMVIAFRTYGCTSFLSGFNKESVMFVNREKKSYRPTPVWKSNFVYYNLCDEQSSKSTFMVVVQYKNNSVVCGKMLAGKIPPSSQRIRSGFSKTGYFYVMRAKCKKSYVLACELIFVVLMLKH